MDTVLNIFIINPVVRRAHDLVSNSRFVSPFYHGRHVNIADSINRKGSLALEPCFGMALYKKKPITFTFPQTSSKLLTTPPPSPSLFHNKSRYSWLVGTILNVWSQNWSWGIHMWHYCFIYNSFMNDMTHAYAPLFVWAMTHIWWFIWAMTHSYMAFEIWLMHI